MQSHDHFVQLLVTQRFTHGTVSELLDLFGNHSQLAWELHLFAQIEIFQAALLLLFPLACLPLRRLLPPRLILHLVGQTLARHETTSSSFGPLGWCLSFGLTFHGLCSGGCLFLAEIAQVDLLRSDHYVLIGAG